MLKNQIASISLGRDRLLITQRGTATFPRHKRHFFITDSKHQFFKYSNKAKDLIFSKTEQLCVSDITYIKISRRQRVLSLITDAWVRKIMGHHLADHLKATGPIEVKSFRYFFYRFFRI